MRMLVKLPGPRPTTIPSRLVGSATRRSMATRTSPARPARSRSPVEVPQTAPNEVAVSKAKITVDPHGAMRLVDVTERNDGTGLGEPVAAVLRPLDERDGPVEVRLEVAPLLGVDPLHAVQVEVGDGRRRVVAVADCEGGARDRAGDTEGARRAADERRLPGAEVARDGDDVTRPEELGEARGDRLGLRRRPRHDLHVRRLEETELDRLLEPG